ncbi:MAG: aminotransferase class III-fold pyridoxal phosphate-dependent enzyme, partial [Anaerovoracaceae bacterium]
SAAKKAEALTGRLEAALGEHPYVGEIRHLGLIHAIELVKNKETKECFPPQERVGYQIYRTALEKGLILRPLGDVLYFNPPLNIEEETLEQAVRMCKEAIVEILGQ